MSMFNDIDWKKRVNSERFISNSEQVKKYAKRYSRGHWSFLKERKRSFTEFSATHLKDTCDSSATQMVERFNETGHPVFKSISALSRGIQKRKNGRDTIHFIADSSNTELLFRTIHPANQLSIYGAVSSWCEEFGQKPNEKEPTSEKENEQQLKNVKPQEVRSLVQTPRSDNPASGNRLRECPQRFETVEKA